jgi:hypothetical protein
MEKQLAHASKGVQVVALLALSDDSAPVYDKDNTAVLAELAVPAFACTPDANLQLRADGTGIGQHEMKGQFTTSTTELGAYLVRIEAAGGTVQCTPAPTTGLIVTVLVPAAPVATVPKPRG